jgi:hypothetical protein
MWTLMFWIGLDAACSHENLFLSPICD